MTQFLYNIRNEIIVLGAIAILSLPGASLVIYSLSSASDTHPHAIQVISNTSSH